MEKKVSVITVNFNQQQLTREFLDSFRIYYGSRHDVELIVVDNGSDFDVTVMQDEFPEVKFIRSEINLGFAGGNNLGIQQASGAWLFFVNNDTELTSGLIESLTEVFKAFPGTGAVSPKIRFFDQPDTIQYAGFTRMNYFTCRNRCIGEFEKDEGQYDTYAGITGYAHGAAMMVSREAIDEAGLMPENFFLYYEEMDWCERIKRAGYEVRFEPGGLIYHKESMSVGKGSPLKEYFMNRNRVLFIRRNGKFFHKAVFYIYFLTVVATRNILSYIARRRGDLAGAFFRSAWWNLTHSAGSRSLGYPVNQQKRKL